MTILSSWNVKSLEEYEKLEPSIVMVVDLEHKALALDHEARAKGWKVYSSTAGRSKKDKWVQFFSFGKHHPGTKAVLIYNNVFLVNYSLFDNRKDLTDKDLIDLAKEMQKYWTFEGEYLNKNPYTISKIVSSMIPATTLRHTKFLDSIESENYDFLDQCFRGGATCIMPKYLNKKVPYESHIDYHQIYSYVLQTCHFPSGLAHKVDGYRESGENEFSIYCFNDNGALARVKKDGYPIIGRNDSTGMAGADGEWFYFRDQITFLCDIDYELFLENYETDIPLEVDSTLYYNHYFEGKKELKELIDTLYKGRVQAEQENKASVKMFYKLMNENIAGNFEVRIRDGYEWKGTERGKKNMYRGNPKVGIWITANARKLLNDLLHMFPHDKVIGYDTDCCFFAGQIWKIPASVNKIMGDKMGQVHLDGNYLDVVHTAAKHYSGWDIDNNGPFVKASGVSKDNKQRFYSHEIGDYILKEVKKDEESR